MSTTLWVITRYQCRFINDNKCTALVWGVDNGEAVGAEGMWEISTPSAQFCSGPKIADQRTQQCLKRLLQS